MTATNKIGPLTRMVQDIKPELMNNPAVMSIVEQYEQTIEPEDAEKLGKIVPSLVEAYESDDYPKFRQILGTVGWDSAAPYVYAMLKESNLT